MSYPLVLISQLLQGGRGKAGLIKIVSSIDEAIIRERADVMAQGVVDAIKELNPNRPIVVCIRGTNEEEAVKIASLNLSGEQL